MSSVRSVKSLGVYGSSATVGVPTTPIAGASYRDTSLLAAELASGWKYATMVNSGAFNEWLYRTSSLVDLLDTHGILGWCDQVDYVVPAVVFGSDGLMYFATAASGPSGVGAKDPTSTGGYWKAAFVDSRVGELVLTLSTTAQPGCVKANGALLSRTGIYADLWAWANASGNIVTDTTWTGSSAYRGAFSSGDGATTFRVPNIRGAFPRFFHDGDTLDPDYATRLIGILQAQAYGQHNHGVNDPGHGHRLPDAYTDFGGHPANIVAHGYPGSRTGDIYTDASTTGITIQNSGGAETRPVNIPFMGWLKYR